MRRLGGNRAGEIRLTRLLRNEAFSCEEMLAEAGARTAERCLGRHVLAIQDTTVLRSEGGGVSICTPFWPWMQRMVRSWG